VTIEADLLHQLVTSAPEKAWQVIVQKAIDIASKPLTLATAPSEVIKRDREIGTLDYFLSSSGWDLWELFSKTVEKTSDRLVNWWGEPYKAKAVLILDGLSLRELPWLLQGAQKRGFTLHQVTANASELPGDTNQFAGALGFGSRSHLQNDGAGYSHRLQSTKTESSDMPWKDCQGLVDFSPNWIFWHHWPDSKLHDGSGAGQGLDTLTQSVAQQLCSEDFWEFVERLATGRRLVITSDHGYAATGYFSDADGEVGQFLRKTFASGRSKAGQGDTGPYVPPVAMQVNSPFGSHLLAVGRWKWKSQGGYPTLTHGGLSLLEVLSPFIELSK
jgi:hypothetical protein